MKFYLLTSSSLEGLTRNVKIIPPEDLVVVVNTLDDDYRISAIDFCKEHKVEFHITESDGTPATGKNSVIKLFLESDNDYMVQIDGDDIITPYGYSLYKSLSQHPTPPDMVVLYRQPQMRSGLDFDYFLELAEDLTKMSREDVHTTKLRFPCDKSEPVYNQQTYEWLLYVFMVVFGKDTRTSHEWATDRYEFNQLMNTYSESREYMTRMVFYSRRIAEQVHFDKTMMIGEDTVQFLKLKRLALDGMPTRGGFHILRRKENSRPTYIMIDNHQSVTNVETELGTDWSWVRGVVDKINSIQRPKPHIMLQEFIDDTYT